MTAPHPTRNVKPMFLPFAYIILFLRRYPTNPANPLPRSSSVESPGLAVEEVVKAASANSMDRNADGKIQMAIISFFISHLAPHIHAGCAKGHSILLLPQGRNAG